MSVGVLPSHLAANWQLPANRVVIANTGTAPGYSAVDLSDGTLGRAWRSSIATTRHALSFQLPSAKKASLIAALDVRIYSTVAKVLRIGCGRGTYQSGGALELAQGTLRRGDVGMGFPAETNTDWYLVIDLTAAAVISIGEVVIGDPIQMATHFREWERDDQRATIRNGDYATRAAARRMRLSCDWAALTAADHATMFDVIDPADGALRPVLFVPDVAAPGELYHGTLDDSHPHSQGPDQYHTGHRIQFVESRRPLGY